MEQAVNQKFRRLLILPAFFVLAILCVANCILAVAGHLHYWRYQSTAVIILVMLAAVEVCLYEPKK